MSTSHKNKNRSQLGLYFRFDCIVIMGYVRICGCDTQEELLGAQAFLRQTLCSLSGCPVSLSNDLS